MITVGTSLTLLINSIPLYFLFKLIYPDTVAFIADDIFYYLFRSLHQDIKALFIFGIITLILPISASTFIFWKSKKYWNTYCAYVNVDLLPQKLWTKFQYNVGRFVSDTVLNYMAKLTIFEEEKEVLIIDILDTQDSLYSGIFVDYHTDKGELKGVSLAKVIRFSFKSEAARKEEKTQIETTSFNGKANQPYILPKLGEMYIPNDKIQNLHFWKIQKDHVYMRKVERPFDEAMVAWYLLLQNMYPDMNFKIKAVVENSTDEWPTFTRILSTLPALSLSGLEIVETKDTKKS